MMNNLIAERLPPSSAVKSSSTVAISSPPATATPVEQPEGPPKPSFDHVKELLDRRQFPEADAEHEQILAEVESPHAKS